MLLLPLLGGLWYAANDALQHRSTTDWRGNRKAKQSLEHAVALIVGAPCLGALLAGMVAAMAGRRAGIPAATGALVGTLALWIAGIVAIYVGLSNATFVF
ncbi:hypothetical protein ACFY1B_44635 [Streptomyces mirabilis]|uniref:hypothetical protein n=1 Tax=Streptomyces mirabilis TaxID=68239 RepID=UPI0036A6424A